ncbi:MAG: 4-hydroxy-tetrahydrodipicolinate reductase [Bacteroidetes bacterium]|jgi:4-hydroxy-tetrahydrodipicolinate reductase|nr:4-hydroxy-tetrahydrodipicolinate reductase [Bacteroidota bacterium]HQW45555.1 4-hydroxy-tetrahydrodipicolinate reductase [Chitinophagaceae bacterium]MBK6818141.1 4-hydroxy-tetrahydrodipicolinate reductase [Bacteroidota bacterium]MBK7040647.1 4-hydroxy-tetrahydrodipicolinate reductase [Bacteroidota bacterium]MBK8328457.1 4-hydroxy-tetrahydrodipicolinate reductase [Bacteroidota bacterium]
MKIALIGYGKMGKAIETIALAEGHEIVLKISSTNLYDFTNANIQQADVCIEFSTPHTAFENIKKCLLAGVPTISGSTAWLHQLEEIYTICRAQDTAFLYASNFSIGVNLFFQINEYVAQLMQPYHEYHVSMEEIHHTAKKDAPSGTAVTLAEGILKHHAGLAKWVNQTTDNPNEMAIISKRIDPAPGTHTIFYNSPIDSIEIKHTAHSRMGFAYGALLAAKFICDKKGIYSMKDVLA